MSWIEAARRSDPTVWRLPLYRGVALYRVGRCEEARREIEAHIRMVMADGGHEDASTWYFLALIALKAGDRAAFERECARIREAFADPDRRPSEDDAHLKEFMETTGFEIPPAPPADATEAAAPVDTPDATPRPRPEIR
jgi:hypothetical protein